MVYDLKSPKKVLFSQFVKFCIVGLLNTTLHLAFFSICIHFGFHYLFSQTIAFFLVNLITFALNKYWTFQNKQKDFFSQMFFYYLGCLFTLGITLLQTFILVEKTGINPFICQITAVGINVVLNFIFSIIFVFKPKPKKKEWYLDQSFSSFKTLFFDTKRTVFFIVPVFHEHNRLYPKSVTNPHGEDFLRVKIDQLDELFERNNIYSWKLIFVDDGDMRKHSGDLIKGRLVTEFEHYKDKVDVWYLKNLNPGAISRSRKGGAVIEGMHKIMTDFVGEKDILIYTDADISSDLSLAGSLIAEIENGADVVISSRCHEGTTVLNRGLHQKVSSWVYNLCVFAILGLDYTDTQNGFKAFSVPCLKKILPYAKDYSFTFDTELLMLCDIHGFGIKEVPTFWEDSPEETNINMMTDSINMFRSLLNQRCYKKYLMARRGRAPRTDKERTRKNGKSQAKQLQ
jgi:putative flippase GtrA